jgi:hypothetical protein
MMTTATTIFVSIVVTLAVVDLRRWIPWLAERIVSAAARNFNERNRRIKDEEYRANLRYAAGPFSMLALALYTFAKAPFRARELRGNAREVETAMAAQTAQLASAPSTGWESDSQRSAAEYDTWYLAHSSAIFTQERERMIEAASAALHATKDFRRFDTDSLLIWPKALTIARACTCPPMSHKRLAGISRPNSRLAAQLERGAIPNDTPEMRTEIQAMCNFLRPRFDRRLLCWLDDDRTPTNDEREHALLAIGERLAQSTHTYLVRTTRCTHQRQSLRAYLESKGFEMSREPTFEMRAGTFGFDRQIAPTNGLVRPLKTVDCVIAPFDRDLPLVLVESVSSDNFTNSIKRLDAAVNTKHELEHSYGNKVMLLHHFFGYFRPSHLTGRGANSIKWVWDHRLDDLERFLGT